MEVNYSIPNILIYFNISLQVLFFIFRFSDNNPLYIRL